MELKDTIEMMQSPDYKERFKAEYWQVKIRLEKLTKMLEGCRHGTLPFKPRCSYNLLNEQRINMEDYCNTLVVRAKVEGIDLNMRTYSWEFCEHCYDEGFCDLDAEEFSSCPKVSYDGIGYGENPSGLCKYKEEG